MKIRLFSGPGTRQWPRFSILEVPSIFGIRSAAGSGINVVDISRGGTLLLTPRRLLPGTRIRLNVETLNGSIPVAGLVLRSSVFSLKEEVQYRAAVVFDCPLKIPLERRKQAVLTSLDAIHQPDRDRQTIADFLAIDFCNEQGEVTPEMLRMNDW